MFGELAFLVCLNTVIFVVMDRNVRANMAGLSPGVLAEMVLRCAAGSGNQLPGVSSGI